MGGVTSTVQKPQTSGTGKGTGSVSAPTTLNQDPKPLDGVGNGYAPRPMGKGGAQTNSATSGQPTIGAPNQYSNTIGQWDNTQIQPVNQQAKGKGA